MLIALLCSKNALLYSGNNKQAISNIQTSTSSGQDFVFTHTPPASPTFKLRALVKLVLGDGKPSADQQTVLIALGARFK